MYVCVIYFVVKQHMLICMFPEVQWSDEEGYRKIYKYIKYGQMVFIALKYTYFSRHSARTTTDLGLIMKYLMCFSNCFEYLYNM